VRAGKPLAGPGGGNAAGGAKRAGAANW